MTRTLAFMYNYLIEKINDWKPDKPFFKDAGYDDFSWEGAD